jgi:hypothetical protein
LGAVSIETYNIQLMTLADYDDAGKLKTLLQNYYNIEGLANCGDSVAASIIIDLKTSVDSDALTPLQRTCITGHLIQKSTLKEMSEDLQRSESTVRQAVAGGIKNIQKALKEGTLYDRRRA